MKTRSRKKQGSTWAILLFALAVGALFTVNARAFTLNVVDQDGVPITGGFRWLLEEDNTNVTDPGVPVRVSISTDIHNSHAPVVASGSAGGSSTDIDNDANGTPLDTGQRLFISVLPDSGYSNGGTVVEAPHPGSVTVTVNTFPIPTAQISVLAFVDHNPINNVADPGEQGLGGATVQVSDAAGQLAQDAFGNPLGTQYDLSCGGPCLDGNGDPIWTVLGNGIITTLTQEQFDAGGAANPYNLQVGEALVKYLVPGKYGLKVIPPAFDDDGVAMTWSQTATIEGTPTVDAWVKANEPPIFIEGFGTGFNHVFFGYVKVSPASSNFRGQTYTTLEWNQTPPAYTGSITGTLRMNHFSRPPELQGFFPGVPVPNGWVGINDPLVQPGVLVGEAGKYAIPCNEDGSFTITNVPPGTYQLVTWDTFLDTLFGFHTVIVPPGPSGTGDAVDLGDVLTFRWFGTLNNYVYFDADEDGFRDPGEPGIPEQNVNIRFRDGTIYQAFPTDLDGFVPFDEVFPFFKWLVVEVDFARFKATGMTTAVDYGGAIPGPAWPANGNKNPQPQDPADPFNEYGTLDYRTETGPVLTQAMHLFLGQTNLIEWGKSHYADGENGGISGIVFYAVTRAENDPRYAAAEEWEPGVPRVQVNLYRDMVINASGLVGSDGVIDDLNGDLAVTLADVDNYPFQWAPMYAAEAGYTGIPGPEDVDDGFTGPLVGSGNGTFDAGDAIQITTTDSWDDNKPSGCIQELPILPGLGAINECADGFGTWNQVRPGLFDGGYAFDSYYPGGIDSGSVETAGLPTGYYIVEAVTPPGYELLKEEDRNVDFGDEYIPSTLLLPPTCVGDLRTVPAFMSFDGATPAPYAGQDRPLCDRKLVNLSTGANAAADFFLFTLVPKAARAVGFVNNDLAAEFNQASPIYGEKLSASWIPISFRDWQGHEIVRVYSDEFGGYNALLPSTYTVNVPSPTGVSPNMITLVLNDPYMADGVTPDPYHDPNYAVTPWTFHYMPGATSYLDTPIIPVAAFTGNDVGLDTGPADGTPVIYSTTTDTQAGPLVCTDTATPPATLFINAPPGGTVTVRNPLYPALSNQPTVIRDVGFGAAQGAGTVTIGGTDFSGNINNWGNEQIEVNLPGGTPSGRVMVTRDNGLTTEVGVTLTITDCSGFNVHTVSAGGSIQTAIDGAAAGDIILVGAGQFNENVIMNKPLRLQGGGTGSFINANPVPLDRLQDWHNYIDTNLNGDAFRDFIGGDPFSPAEAPGIFVIGEIAFTDGTLENPGPNPLYMNQNNLFDEPSAIDGFAISGSKAGGGIFVFGSASGLEISNTNIFNNQGNFGGGIAVGMPEVAFDWNNAGVVIRDNKVHRNGGVQGGGGIALNHDSDDYLVENNLIIGNFGRFNGGGIQHRGLSTGDNIIRGNRILFNEVFFGALLALAGDGAGIFIGADAVGDPGTGTVTIDSNLIQGNMTGSGNGAGIRAFAVNGLDVDASPDDDSTWYRLNIFNNMIVNNVAGNAGGGIALQDVARANIINNTIARNDSTATSQLAFEAGQPNSTPQPAGLVSNPHSATLTAMFGQPEPAYSDPLLVNNIIYQNRSFYNDASLNGGAGGLAVNPAGQYWDLHVLGSVSGTDPHMDPDYCVLSSLTNPATGYDYTLGGTDTTNSQFSPAFLGPYFNTIESTTVIDEGGNAINIRFTPLTIDGSDYHIGMGFAWESGTNAYLGTFAELNDDIDGEPRPFGPNADIGADELQSAPGPAPLALSTGNKGTAAQLAEMGPMTNVRSASGPASMPADMAAAVTDSLVTTVKETVAGAVKKLLPDKEHLSTPVTGGRKNGIKNPAAGDAPALSSGNGSPVSMSLRTAPGFEESTSLQNNPPLNMDQQPDGGRTIPSESTGEVSLSAPGMESVVPGSAGKSGTALAGSRQADSKTGLFRYALVGLLLVGLGFIFVAVFLPKARKDGDQKKRGEI